jgi:two-component system, chemotaxis family, CheB/CheR fusion protein
VPSLAGLSVLAVDDNQDALEVLGLALRQAGADVRVASSGADAIAEWERRPADVLMCDLSMPRMSGFELLDRIRGIDQAAGRVTPAIAVTAHATQEEMARTARAGFQMHLAKPIDMHRLVRAVSVVRTRTQQT